MKRLAIDSDQTEDISEDIFQQFTILPHAKARSREVEDSFLRVRFVNDCIWVKRGRREDQARRFSAAARATMARRPFTPSFSEMFSMWVRTVSGDITNCAAISRSVR